jgi:hypothetical protein
MWNYCALADKFALYRDLGRSVFLSVDPDGLRGEKEDGCGGRSTYSSQVTCKQDGVLQI